jgi:NitT/TauT family transport system permease protein
MKKYLSLILPGLLLLLTWEMFCYNQPQRLFFFSAPSAIIQTFIAEIRTASLYTDIFYTGFAAASGLVLGTIAGTLLGMVSWARPFVARIAKPYMLILGAVPVFALAPMLILWFGIGLWSKIVLAAFAVFLIASSQAYEGAAQTASRHLLFARSLNASPSAMICHIVFPGAMQWIKAGMRMSINFALTATFIAEFISSEHGLGHYILKAGGLYDMPRVFTGLILMALLSVGTNKVVAVLR